MKHYLNSDQTAKLIGFGFEKPPKKGLLFQSNIGNRHTDLMLAEENYSIGELIEMLEEVASVVISYSYQKRGYYVRVIIPKRIGGGMYRISQIELVDALYDMIIRLKEEGKI